MAIDWNSKETRYLKFTLSVLIENMNNANNMKEKKKRGNTINEITKILRSRGESV